MVGWVLLLVAVAVGRGLLLDSQPLQGTAGSPWRGQVTDCQAGTAPDWPGWGWARD